MNPRQNNLLRLLAWVGLLVVLCAAGTARLDWRQPVDTNLLLLLPAEPQSSLESTASSRVQDGFAHELLVTVDAVDPESARRGAAAAATALTSAGLTLDAGAGRLQDLSALYRKHRFALLTDDDRARLERDPVDAFSTEIAGQLANPAGALGLFGDDPGGYFTRYLTQLPAPFPGFLPDGDFLSRTWRGRTTFLLHATQTESAFEEAGAAQAVAAVDTARRAVASACAGCELRATGAGLFADAARRDAQHEVFWLSTASTLFIMLVIMLVFGSLRPHLLGALCMAASVLAASAAVATVFGHIHLLTLVCGTTLLGIAIDYAFMYFAAHWFGSQPPACTLATVLPGLTLGLVTALIAFSFLLLAGFPALDQIAVFSDAGLLAAYATVVLMFPVLLHGHRAKPWRAVLGWPQQFVAAARVPGRRRWIVPLAALLIAAPGWSRLQVSDDLGELQHFPPQLLKTDQDLRTFTGRDQAPGYFLVQGRDLQEALQREEALFTGLRDKLPGAQPLGLSDFLPSEPAQRANHETWSAVFAHPAALDDALTRLGLPVKFGRDLEAAWHAAPSSPLTADALFQAEPSLQRFVLNADGDVALLSTVKATDAQTDALAALAATHPGARFVEPLAQLRARFAEIRRTAAGLVVVGYLLIAVLLLWRYGRREALRMLYPPVLALAVTLGVLGWAGVPVSIFVLVALILVLGLGRDYIVFLKEGVQQDRAAALAVFLSAMTTLCAFGLLILSRIPALHAFGLATLIGILMSCLGAPLSLPPEEEKH